MPSRPLVTSGSPSSPALANASWLARVAITATRPMLRVVLRLYSGGSAKGAAGAPKRVFRPSYLSHSARR